MVFCKVLEHVLTIGEICEWVVTICGAGVMLAATVWFARTLLEREHKEKKLETDDNSHLMSIVVELLERQERLLEKVNPPVAPAKTNFVPLAEPKRRQHRVENKLLATPCPSCGIKWDISTVSVADGKTIAQYLCKHCNESWSAELPKVEQS